MDHLSPQETKADEAHLQDKGIAPTLHTVKFPAMMLGPDLPALRWRWALQKAAQGCRVFRGRRRSKISRCRYL